MGHYTLKVCNNWVKVLN